MKKFEELSYDELSAIATQLFGLTKDEVKTTFRSETALRQFIEEAKASRGVIENDGEDSIGWDKTDKTPLDDEGKKIVSKLKKGESAELSKSIKAAGGKVSPSDVQNAMADVRKLLDEDDEDD